VEPVVEDEPRKAPAAMKQFLSNAKIKFDELSHWSLPKTAGDALAGCLRSQLALLDAETAPVRSKKMLAPSVIAGVAIDILATCVLFDQPPGQELVDLFRALLKVDKRPLKSSREFSARYRAAWMLAQKPNVSTRQLARILDVEPSSVSRWRKDASFGKMVESKKQSIQDLKARGLWPPPRAREVIAVKEKEFRDMLSGLKKARNEMADQLASCHEDGLTNAETTQIEEAIRQLDEFLSKEDVRVLDESLSRRGPSFHM
jgi:DNA-binding MarR family transcriptional regulator